MFREIRIEILIRSILISSMIYFYHQPPKKPTLKFQQISVFFLFKLKKTPYIYMQYYVAVRYNFECGLQFFFATTTTTSSRAPGWNQTVRLLHVGIVTSQTNRQRNASPCLRIHQPHSSLALGLWEMHTNKRTELSRASGICIYI